MPTVPLQMSLKSAVCSMKPCACRHSVALIYGATHTIVTGFLLTKTTARLSTRKECGVASKSGRTTGRREATKSAVTRRTEPSIAVRIFLFLVLILFFKSQRVAYNRDLRYQVTGLLAIRKSSSIVMTPFSSHAFFIFGFCKFNEWPRASV